MAQVSQPIAPARFAAAIQELPVENLHSTAAEIRHSLNHLQSSNEQLKPLADEGDQICKEAIDENEEVMGRMRARIDMLKAEVERRGMPWPDENESTENGQREGGDSVPYPTPQNGSLTDDELRRRMEQRMLELEDDDESNENGVHL